MSIHVESVKSAYQQRNDFFLIALTGRTGVGCSTTATILKTETFQELDLHTPKVHGFENNEERKYAIVHNYMKDDHWQPFTVIEASSIIFSYIVEKGIKALREYIQNFEEINEKNQIRISAFSDLQKSINSLNYIFDSQKYCDLKNIDEILQDEKLVEDYYKFYIYTLPKLKQEFEKILSNYTCHEEYVTRFDQTKFKKAHLYTFLMQKVGNNIRSSGDPYLSKYSEKDFYSVAKRIDCVIQITRRYNQNHAILSTRVCIDAIRNPYEAFYFKDKYSTCYLISVNTDEATRQQRLGHLDAEELESLDAIEFPLKFTNDYEMFFHQNISGCLEISDIHLYNPQQLSGKYYFLTEQILKYVCLLIHPGLITPSDLERCMQLAYTVKLNSGCLSRQVGAIITDQEFSVKAVGWNDVPAGQVPCNLRDVENYCINKDADSYSEFEINDVKFSSALYAINNKFKNTSPYGRAFSYCFKDVYNGLKDDKNQIYTRSLHAEENSFLQLAKYGGQGIQGGCLFTTASPCELCAKKAYQLGIRDIYYIDPYPGISFSHILKFGKKQNPNLHLFHGAIGAAYVSLYTQRIAIKDELALMTDITCKKVKDYMVDQDTAHLGVEDIKYTLQDIEFVFETRENIYTVEEVKLKTLREGISKISNSVYWTGSSFDGMDVLNFEREGKPSKEYVYTVKNNGVQPYVGMLTLEQPLKKGEEVSLKTKINVKDASHIMNPYYAQIITVKTKQLFIHIKAKGGLLKNVSKVVYADTKMTPKFEVERELLSAKKEGDYFVYTVEQEHPNLNYSYCIEWNFIINA